MERNIDALRQLRRVVEAAPEDRFEMRRFCTQSDCGTAYCAAGWATIDPWFRENTAILEYFESFPYKAGAVVREKSFDTFIGLESIFRIGPRNTTALFGGNLDRWSGSVRREEVLERIDALIQGLDIDHYPAANSDE